LDSGQARLQAAKYDLNKLLMDIIKEIIRKKLILKEYINSIDNASRLKEFYTDTVQEIIENLKTLNKKTKNKSTKIKINEIVSLIKVPAKNSKLKDKDLVDLLQYCDLVNELETANG
jgi:hypothetical protein